MPTARPIRVAIIGGGLAGLALANALVRRPNPQDTAPDHPGFDVQVFEAKPVLSERGAAVGLGQGARIALKYCIPDADDMLQRAGAVPQAGTQMMVGSGKHAGAAIIALGSAVKPISNIDSEPQDKPAPEKEAPNTGGPVVVHRPSLLHGLKQSLEEGSKANRTIHTSKRLASIQIGDGEEVTITFEDGCVDKFDAVIGADGYRGAVRSHVLGDKAETQAVLQSGFWDCRNMVSMDVAKELFYKPLREALRSRATTAEERATVDDYFGEGDSFDRHSQWGWAGDTGFVMHDVCENGTKVQCVIAAVEKTPWKERKYPLTRDFVREHLEGWMDGPVLPAMLDVSPPTK
ncbi:hypothetical protein ANO11243_034480 [Dothideomycetidae sp. 11243]|nr:hypothetical protein ANO11243_034480 [fungal sp. No.11243]